VRLARRSLARQLIRPQLLHYPHHADAESREPGEEGYEEHSCERLLFAADVCSSNHVFVSGVRRIEELGWISYECCSDMLPARRKLFVAAQYRR